MTGFGTILKRELSAYFATPVAYVFIVIFLVITGVFTFYIGGFYERGQADLEPFFRFHPWIYMFLIPAISMRLWSEERSAGTLELLLTLPVSLTVTVMGKFSPPGVLPLSPWPVLCRYGRRSTTWASLIIR